MIRLLIPLILLAVITSCSSGSDSVLVSERIPILIDSDANNEIDDQHAIAYALLDTTTFEVVGITVNDTYNGNGIENQYQEAIRVARLCNRYPGVEVIKGAQGNFREIVPHIEEAQYDGKAAVDFIIEQAHKEREGKLVLAPIGKLTNIALAFASDPTIIDKVRVVWLGSNYPESGEYNLINDTTSVNPVIQSGVEFEMVTVRYGKPSGTAAVTITPETVMERMPGKGPKINEPVTGRHNGQFTTIGDYFVSLFEHTEMYGDPPSRSLFDMAAIAIIKEPSWASNKQIPAPTLQGDAWKEGESEAPRILIWENFQQEKIIEDLFNVVEKY